MSYWRNNRKMHLLFRVIQISKVVKMGSFSDSTAKGFTFSHQSFVQVSVPSWRGGGGEASISPLGTMAPGIGSLARHALAVPYMLDHFARNRFRKSGDGCAFIFF